MSAAFGCVSNHAGSINITLFKSFFANIIIAIIFCTLFFFFIILGRMVRYNFSPRRLEITHHERPITYLYPQFLDRVRVYYDGFRVKNLIGAPSRSYFARITLSKNPSCDGPNHSGVSVINNNGDWIICNLFCTFHMNDHLAMIKRSYGAMLL